MATVSLFQQRSALGPGGYQITNNITASNGIPAELFVYTTADGLFNHVASMDDFQYPVTRVTAQNAGAAFYRLAAATAIYPDVATALDFANLIKKRVNSLLLVFDDTTLTFVGSETTNLPL